MMTRGPCVICGAPSANKYCSPVHRSPRPAIRAGYMAGLKLRTIGEAVRLSPVRVANVVSQERRKGLLPARDGGYLRAVRG